MLPDTTNDAGSEGAGGVANDEVKVECTANVYLDDVATTKVTFEAAYILADPPFNLNLTEWDSLNLADMEAYVDNMIKCNTLDTFTCATFMAEEQVEAWRTIFTAKVMTTFVLY